jgi:hypothetical protein
MLHVASARASGRLSLLPTAVDYLAGFHLHAGHFVKAIALTGDAAEQRGAVNNRAWPARRRPPAQDTFPHGQGEHWR